MPDLPTDEELRALLAGKISPVREEEITLLLETTPDLAERLESLSGVEDFTGEFQPDTLSSHNIAEHSLDHFELEKHAPDGRIGKFEVLEIAGAGGMGTVLKANDPDLDRIVALKILRPDLAKDDDALERFRREASSIAAIDHEHVLPIYDITEESGFLFFVTRYVEGETLQDRLDRNPDGLPIDEVIEIGRAVSLALEAAHESDVIHRDVKPSNILLENDGKIWLMDFGLAGETEDRIAGTPHYMAPEQIEGNGSTSAQSDLFSLGVVLHTMLTGKPPFEGEDLRHILWQISNHEIESIERKNGLIPGWLSNLTLQLLEKEPQNRPASAAVVSQLFRKKFVSNRERRSRRLRLTLILFAILLLGAGCFGFMQWRSTYLATHPFVVDGSDRFQTLTEAAEKVKTNGVIEIQRTGKIRESSPRRWKKPVTLRAGKDHEPVLVCQMKAGAIWITEDNFTMEGISVHLQVNAQSRGAFLLASGENLIVRNCSFTVPKTEADSIENSPSRIIFEASEVETSLIERNQFNGLEVAVYVIRAKNQNLERTITIRENLAISRSFFQIQYPNYSSSPIKVTLNDNMVYSNNNIVLRPLPGRVEGNLGTVEFSAKGNIFQSNGGLIFASREFVPQLKESLQWHGNQNLYSGHRMINPEGGATEYNIQFPMSLEAWRNGLQSPENGSILTSKKQIQVNVYDAKEATIDRPIVRNPKSLEQPYTKGKTSFRLDRTGPKGRD